MGAHKLQHKKVARDALAAQEQRLREQLAERIVRELHQKQLEVLAALQKTALAKKFAKERDVAVTAFRLTLRNAKSLTKRQRSPKEAEEVQTLRTPRLEIPAAASLLSPAADL